jgi:hypothetical protein
MDCYQVRTTGKSPHDRQSACLTLALLLGEKDQHKDRSSSSKEILKVLVGRVILGLGRFEIVGVAVKEMYFSHSASFPFLPTVALFSGPSLHSTLNSGLGHSKRQTESQPSIPVSIQYSTVLHTVCRNCRRQTM